MGDVLARYSVILVLVLAALWLSLSGYFKPLLLILGVVSILAVLGLCARMKILDQETVPYLNTHKAFFYFNWLFKEIVKANMSVVKAVLSPDMEVSPSLVKVPMNRGSDIGRTMFANSITLTPGTVSMEISEDEILVHALLEEMSAPAGFAEMEKRSGWSVGDDTETPERAK